MSESITLNLSRALKLKNRLVNRLARLDGLIIQYNSTPDDKPEYDVRELYRSRTRLVTHLIDLKTAINTANQPIQSWIYQIAEAKALVGTLNKIDTKHGTVVEGFNSVRVSYVSQMRKPEVDREVRRIEREIDRLQEELDRFNFKTMITIDPSMLEDEEHGPSVLLED